MEPDSASAASGYSLEVNTLPITFLIVAPIVIDMYLRLKARTLTIKITLVFLPSDQI
jgi:hypothetical protein